MSSPFIQNLQKQDFIYFCNEIMFSSTLCTWCKVLLLWIIYTLNWLTLLAFKRFDFIKKTCWKDLYGLANTSVCLLKWHHKKFTTFETLWSCTPIDFTCLPLRACFTWVYKGTSSIDPPSFFMYVAKWFHCTHVPRGNSSHLVHDK